MVNRSDSEGEPTRDVSSQRSGGAAGNSLNRQVDDLFQVRTLLRYRLWNAVKFNTKKLLKSVRLSQH